MNRPDVVLEPFEPKHIGLLADWLARPHVARWFGDAGSHLDWARDPPQGGSHAIIALEGRPLGYLRWQSPSREVLDSVGLTDIPAGSVDADLFLGESSYIGRGIGPAALRLLLEALRADTSVRLVGLSTSVDNRAARRAFEKAGFRLSRQYSPPGFGPCLLLVAAPGGP